MTRSKLRRSLGPTPARGPVRPLGLERLEDRLTPSVSVPNLQYLNQVYQDVFQRPVDPIGLAYWGTQLDAGVSRTQVALGIENSTEFRTLQLQSVYQRFLSRPIDPVGLSYGLSVLQGGGTLTQVEASVAASPEFFFVHGSTNDGFLRGLIAAFDIQDRLAPAAVNQEVSDWENVLAGGVGRDVVSGLFITGVETGAQRFSIQTQTLYQRLLGRNPVIPADTDYWTAVGQQQGGLNAVMAGILGSQEYFVRAQTIAAGTTVNQPKPTFPDTDQDGTVPGNIETTGLDPDGDGV